MDKIWTLQQTSFSPLKLQHNETVFMQGNGYMGTRGAFEERYPGEERTTFVHGVFDDVPIVFTELVNFPDWLNIEIILAGERFCMTDGQLLEFGRSLDLRNGLLNRKVLWRSPKGLTTSLEFKRFVSFTDVHLTCMQVTIIAQDYNGTLEIRSGLNANTDNLNYKHWEWLGQGFEDQTIWLKLKTKSTKIVAGMAERLQIVGETALESDFWDVTGCPTLRLKTTLTAGHPLQIEKVAAIFTSRDVNDPLEMAKNKLAALPKAAWDELWNPHVLCWEENWNKSDVIIEGDEKAQLALRFNLYNLLIAASRYDEHVNIGAKTLSGYGYRGHSFWDTEIFILPYFTFTQPDIARNLLSYRYHNLPGAREKAQANGFEGAQFPWESAGSGREVTPTWVPNPDDPTKLIRIWTGDIQIHISADIAFAIWQYWIVSGDDDFMVKRGAEIILDTARFWVSRAEWNQEKERYEFNKVIGPDENHDHVNNNAYTNYLVHWHLQLAVQLVKWLKKHDPLAATRLFALLELNENDIDQFKKIAEKIYRPFDADTKLVEQFDGYFALQYIDLKALEGRKESIQGMLGIEKTNQTQILKQPDVIMLMNLFPDEFDLDVIRKNYQFYTERTDLTYGSSLGPSIQSIVASRLQMVDQAYAYFLQAAFTDIDNLRGNAEDGIHAASAGGLWQTVVFGFAGLRYENDGWSLNPQLPPTWKRLAFKFRWRGEEIKVDLRPERYAET